MEENKIKEKAENVQEHLLPCTTASDAEHARAHDEDEPCDDGRAGVTDKES